MPAGPRIAGGSMSFEALKTLGELLKNPDLFTEPQRKSAEKLIKQHASLLIKQQTLENEKYMKAAKQRAEAAKQMESSMRHQQEICLHQKENEITGAVDSFLVGQFLQEPFGMLMLFCQDTLCGKIYSFPAHPKEGWPLVPKHLIPRRGVGGVGDISALLQQYQKLGMPLTEKEAKILTTEGNGA